MQAAELRTLKDDPAIYTVLFICTVCQVKLRYARISVVLQLKVENGRQNPSNILGVLLTIGHFRAIIELVI